LVGYEGEYCTANIDDCAEGLCLNGGQCVDGVNEYSCHCLSGFGGDDCSNVQEWRSDAQCGSQFPLPSGGPAQCNPEDTDGFVCCSNLGHCGNTAAHCACDGCIDYSVKFRLASSTGAGTRSAGRVEVYHNGEWGTICDDYWELDDAAMVCKALGFDGATEAPLVAAYGEGSGTIFLDDVQCGPNAARLDDCTHADWGVHNCGHHEDASAVCFLDIDSCLAAPCQNGGQCQDGFNSYTCTCSDGFQGEQCQNNIDDCATNPCMHGGVCEDAVNSFNCRCATGYDGVHCENNIDDCAADYCQNGGVCVDGLDSYSCNCPATFAGPNCETKIRCPYGYESRGSSGCYMRGYYTMNKATAMQFCADNGGYLAIITSAEEQAEVVQLAREAGGKFWLSLTDSQNEGVYKWGDGTALSYAAWNAGEPNNANNEDCIEMAAAGEWKWNDVKCASSNVKPMCEITPTVMFRLAGTGSSESEGRVEVYHDGEWGTVCDDAWDINDANMVCRTLGFSGAAESHGTATYGQGAGATESIFLDNVNCGAGASRLSDCTHNGWNSHNCGHHEDASVKCSPFRIIGGSSDREGRVEVFHAGDWGTVCDDHWDINDAHMVCKTLGFSGAREAKKTASYGEGSGLILLDDVNCGAGASNLDACTHPGWGTHNCGHHEDAGVMCNRCEGGDSCCVGGNCGLGEGDCDNHSDCQLGLVCGTNNCPDPFDTFNWDDDCCEEN